MSTEDANGMESGGENEGESYYNRTPSSQHSWHGSDMEQGEGTSGECISTVMPCTPGVVLLLRPLLHFHTNKMKYI